MRYHMPYLLQHPKIPLLWIRLNPNPQYDYLLVEFPAINVFDPHESKHTFFKSAESCFFFAGVRCLKRKFVGSSRQARTNRLSFQTSNSTKRRTSQTLKNVCFDEWWIEKTLMAGNLTNKQSLLRWWQPNMRPKWNFWFYFQFFAS